ncbi:hypothetical protein ACJX0J_012950, partial [Zea mays]
EAVYLKINHLHIILKTIFFNKQFHILPRSGLNPIKFLLQEIVSGNDIFTTFYLCYLHLTKYRRCHSLRLLGI